MKRANGISDFSDDGGVLRWVYPDRIGTVSFDLNAVPEYAAADPFIQSALYNGFKQTLVDAAAKSGATVAEKFAAQSARADTLREREWTSRRDGVNSLLVAVLVHYYAGAKTAADVRKQVEPWSAAERLKVLYSDRLAKSRKAVEATRRPKDDGTADKLLDAAAKL